MLLISIFFHSFSSSIEFLLQHSWMTCLWGNAEVEFHLRIKEVSRSTHVLSLIDIISDFTIINKLNLIKTLFKFHKDYKSNYNISNIEYFSSSISPGCFSYLLGFLPRCISSSCVKVVRLILSRICFWTIKI